MSDVIGYCGTVCWHRGCDVEIVRPNSLRTEDLTAAGWDSPVYVWSGNQWSRGSYCPKHARWWSLTYWTRRYAWRLGRIGIRAEESDGLVFGCFKCRTPTKYVNWHITDVPSQGGGFFCLCIKCWADLTPEQRLPFYRQLFDYWMRSGADDDDPPRVWSNYASAVLNEKPSNG